MDSQIFNHFKKNNLLFGLDDLQLSKFDLACKKAVAENPELNFDELCIAAKIYLNFIREYPDLKL
jgi:hypothetical protein